MSVQKTELEDKVCLERQGQIWLQPEEHLLPEQRKIMLTPQSKKLEVPRLRVPLLQFTYYLALFIPPCENRSSETGTNDHSLATAIAISNDCPSSLTQSVIFSTSIRETVAG